MAATASASGSHWQDRASAVAGRRRGGPGARAGDYDDPGTVTLLQRRRGCRPWPALAQARCGPGARRLRRAVGTIMVPVPGPFKFGHCQCAHQWRAVRSQAHGAAAVTGTVLERPGHGDGVHTGPDLTVAVYSDPSEYLFPGAAYQTGSKTLALAAGEPELDLLVLSHFSLGAGEPEATFY